MIDVGKIYLTIVEFLAPLRRANWKVIVLCFSTAGTFWFFNALNKVYTTKINYPVSIVYNHDSLTAVKDPPEEIPINVTGGGWQLLKRTISVNTEPVMIKPENPVNTQYLTSSNLLPIFAGQLTDLNVNYIAVDTIFFNIEPFADRRLPIDLDSLGIHLKENYYITTPVMLKPDSINFHGPVSLVDQLPELFVISLSDKDISKNFDEDLSLDIFSPSLIKKDPEVIHVKFGVEQFVNVATDLDIQLVNFPYDSSVFIDHSILHGDFKIQKSKRGAFKNQDILLIADLNNIRATDSTIVIEIMDIPEYIKDFTLDEDRVKVVYAK